jgi:predicted MFS family arabinose efflux permease
VPLGAGLLIGVALGLHRSRSGGRLRAVVHRSRTGAGAITRRACSAHFSSAPPGRRHGRDARRRRRASVLALGMLPAAWIAGGRLPVPAFSPALTDRPDPLQGGLRASAFASAPFLVMTAAYFVCGMQLLFITTHLPSYLAICGMDPTLSAEALAMIGLFNVFGGLFFGWAGGRWSKLALLGGIYISRSIVLGWYFLLPPTPATTLIFASLMGFLWLGVGPLVAGSVAEMFGLRWQAMIQGIAFMSHQLGSFVGAFGGGLLFDSLGSYDLAWRLGVAMGLVAGIVQVSFALLRPPPRPAAE